MEPPRELIPWLGLVWPVFRNKPTLRVRCPTGQADSLSRCPWNVVLGSWWTAPWPRCSGSNAPAALSEDGLACPVPGRGRAADAASGPQALVLQPLLYHTSVCFMLKAVVWFVYFCFSLPGGMCACQRRRERESAPQEHRHAAMPSLPPACASCVFLKLSGQGLELCG